MNKITKLLVALVIGIVFAMGANAISKAVWDAPLDQYGMPLHDVGFQGKMFKQVVGGTATVVCTGKCLLYDIILSSGASTDYTVVLDSSAVANAHEHITDQLMWTTTDKSFAGTSKAFPIYCQYGITVDQTGTTAAEQLVIYRDLD